jgi:hypothetical protein
MCALRDVSATVDIRCQADAIERRLVLNAAVRATAIAGGHLNACTRSEVARSQIRSESASYHEAEDFDWHLKQQIVHEAYLNRAIAMTPKTRVSCSLIALTSS